LNKSHCCFDVVEKLHGQFEVVNVKHKNIKSVFFAHGQVY
jgi:hypothetical protein